MADGLTDDETPDVSTKPEVKPEAPGYCITQHPNGMKRVQRLPDYSEAIYGTDEEVDAWLAENPED